MNRDFGKELVDAVTEEEMVRDQEEWKYFFGSCCGGAVPYEVGDGRNEAVQTIDRYLDALEWVTWLPKDLRKKVLAEGERRSDKYR